MWAPPDDVRTRFVLVRHGATEHSAARRFSGRNDLPLNDVGRAQAAALARRAFPGAEAIVSSPIRRARETADALSAALGLPVSDEQDFAEVDFGEFEGLTPAEAAQRPEYASWLASPHTALPGGESFEAAAERVERGRAAVAQRFAGLTVVVVSHVTPIKLLVRSALGAPLTSIYRMHLDTASVSIVDYLPGGSSSVRLFNDTAHVR